jgi:hypothetical protein
VSLCMLRLDATQRILLIFLLWIDTKTCDENFIFVAIDLICLLLIVKETRVEFYLRLSVHSSVAQYILWNIHLYILFQTCKSVFKGIV